MSKIGILFFLSLIILTGCQSQISSQSKKISNNISHSISKQKDQNTASSIGKDFTGNQDAANIDVGSGIQYTGNFITGENNVAISISTGSFQTGISMQSNITQINFVIGNTSTIGDKFSKKSKITKIGALKYGLSNFVDTIGSNKNLHVGVRTYSACDVSNSQINVSQIDLAKVKESINNIYPKSGSRSTSYALQKAGDDFDKTLSGNKIIVLMLDGLDTCGYSPCDTANDLKSKNAIEKIYVLGFGMTSQQYSKLQCIVTPFGGKVYNIFSSAGVESALNDIKQLSMETDSQILSNIPPTNITDIQTLDAGSGNFQLIGKDILGTKIEMKAEIYQNGKIIDSRTGSVINLNLNPGYYNIVATDIKTTNTVRVNGVQVIGGQKNIKEILFDEGSLRLDILNGNGENVISEIQVFDQFGKIVSTGLAGTILFKLKSGIYNIRVKNQFTQQEKTINSVEVRPGYLAEEVVVFKEGFVSLKILDSKNVPFTGYMQIIDNNGKQITGAFLSQFSGGVLPGIYDIYIKNLNTDEQYVFSGIDFFKDSLFEKTIVFQSGMVKVLLQDTNGNPLKGYIYIYDANGKQVKFSQDYSVNWQLKPGKYVLKISKTQNAKQKEYHIDIEDGAILEQKIIVE